MRIFDAHGKIKPTLPPKAWDLRQGVGLQWKMDSRLRGNDKKRREGHRRAGMTRKVRKRNHFRAPRIPPITPKNNLVGNLLLSHVVSGAVTRHHFKK